MSKRDFYISIASIFFALLALGVSTLTGLIDKNSIWISFVLIVIFSILLSGLMLIYHKALLYRDSFVCREIISQVRNIQASPDPWWVVKKDQIVELESNSSEVWIITPDFYFDSMDPVFSQIVEKNILLGKKYKYVYPAENEALANTLKNKLKKVNPSHNAEFIPVEDKSFGIIGFEIALYDPLDPTSANHKGVFVDILSERKKNNPKYEDFVDVYLDSHNRAHYIWLVQEMERKSP